jgi:hypothetical protein
MAAKSRRTRATRRRLWRYIAPLIVVAVLFAGWSWLWHFASGKAQTAIDGWRAREAKAGRIYTCGSQTIGGYPFRIEVTCAGAAALLRSNQPPVEIKTSSILIAAKVYQPQTLTSRFNGPLTIAEPGHAATIVANWKFGQSRVAGTPAAPERVSVVFDSPTVDRVADGARQNVLHAKRIEVYGRIVEGSAANKPVIETVLRLAGASAPGLHPAAVKPVDAQITAVLRGLNDFSPKPWPARFREMQAAGGRIDITQARVQQGETLAVGSGALMLNANGRLQGQLLVTVAGVEPFLASINAPQAVQSSPDMDKVAGALDRLLPGLGGVARQQATSSNLSLGINLLGEHTTLEGKPAVKLPLRFEDGSIFLGPIKIGNAPALF